MSTINAIVDSLSNDVPKLQANRVNWGIFQECFVPAIQAKDKWGHYDGTTPCPTAAIPSAPTTTELLNQKIPDSTIMKIRRLDTVGSNFHA